MRGITLPLTLIVALFAVNDTALAKKGRNAAAIGGVAAGVVGGVLLNQMLQQPAEAAPVYEEQPPGVVYGEPQPRYSAPAQARYQDPAFDRMGRLRDACDAGSRRACVRFGMILGENRAQERQWRRNRPDFYEWERW